MMPNWQGTVILDILVGGSCYVLYKFPVFVGGAHCHENNCSSVRAVRTAGGRFFFH
jgi:hypothetical protein